MVARCVNLDWLEVHALEPFGEPLDHFFFSRQGYNVRKRGYGTRVYREMFSILAPNDEPLLEIRRNPASQGLQGIHDERECHIRLCNRTCYFDNAADMLINFLTKFNYEFLRISRVDVCLDFVQFDKGDDPQAFIRRYIKHKYAKINQGRISGHGEDTWSGQEWNSLAWGSKTSAVTTKMYNKTLELYDTKLDIFKKPYIREAWFKCGLIDNIQRVTKNNERVNVWRVEFSLRSAVKKWVAIELDGVAKRKQSLHNTLDVWNSRDKMLMMFDSLQRHYFHFKKYQEGKRKDRCPDKVLFDFDENHTIYKIGRPDTALGSGETYTAKFNRLIEKIRAYQVTHTDKEVYKACEVLLNSLTEENIRHDMSNPWDNEELEFLKTLLHVRSRDKSLTYDVAVEEVRKLLGITKRITGETS